MNKIFVYIRDILYQGAINISFLGIVPSLLYVLFFTFVNFNVYKSICGCVVIFTLLHTNKTVQGVK